MKPQMQRIALAAVLALIVIGYALLLWRGPWWIDGAHLRTKNLQPADGVVITGFRTMLVALGAGAVAAFGLYYTHKGHKQTEALFEHTRAKDREQAELTREGQVTERYVQAIKLLAADNFTQQLGGIYALERILHDSEKDHNNIVEVLAAFVRQEGKKARVEENSEPIPIGKPSVQAAVSVLGRRPRREERNQVNLAGVMLRVAELPFLNLSFACLDYADLGAANLQKGSLASASLYQATLSGADLRGAHLDGASLASARLDKAQMNGATLKDADLRGANLLGATGLKAGELCDARLDSKTVLPKYVSDDQRVKDRIVACETRWAGPPAH